MDEWMNTTIHLYLSVQVSSMLFIQLLLLVMIVSEPGPEQATVRKKSPRTGRDFEQDQRLLGDGKRRRRRTERRADYKQHKCFKCWILSQQAVLYLSSLLQKSMSPAEGLDLLHCVRNKRTDGGLLSDFQQDTGSHVSHQTVRSRRYEGGMSS